MLLVSVHTGDLQTVYQSPMVWCASAEPLQGLRQSTSVMTGFIRMVKLQESAREMVYGMEVHLSASQLEQMVCFNNTVVTHTSHF